MKSAPDRVGTRIKSALRIGHTVGISSRRGASHFSLYSALLVFPSLGIPLSWYSGPHELLLTGMTTIQHEAPGRGLLAVVPTAIHSATGAADPEPVPGWRPYRERGQHSIIQSEQERKHRSTIFPDVVNQLAMQDADVLVTHEAPSCHPRGFHLIDTLARYLGVDKSFHGHHHDNIDYQNQWRWICFEAHGVGFRGITDLNGKIIFPGQSS